MIPKLIHYCWFGGNPLPELAQKCIASWKKYLPEYEIKEWNENNFDISQNLYVKEAYEARKYAFVTDYVRLYALYHEGGIYMDTDVEVLKSLDRFLIHSAFSGFEDEHNIPTGIMGSERNGRWARENLQYYDNKHFVNPDGGLDTTTNVEIITNYMMKYGLMQNNSYQDFPGVFTVYPKDYFCPKDHGTGCIYLTENTYCIHHFMMSWLPSRQVRVSNIKRKMIRFLGIKRVDFIINFFHLKTIKEKLIQ